MQIMEDEIPGYSGQKFPQNYTPSFSGKLLQNISLQTGEEFSMDFLQDRATPRHGLEPGYVKRVGFNIYQNFHPGYEDLTSSLGLRRSESDSNSDVANATLSKGHVMEAGNEVYADRTSSILTGNDQKLPASEYSEFGSLSDPFQDYQQGSGASESPLSDKVKFLCSFGGKILPRPGDGRLRYVGGETRILSIRKNLLWKDLMQRTLSICNQPHTIRYQLPGEDLDALISVSSDEDINNMMEEYYGLEKSDGSQRLRIFLVPLNESENCSIDTRCLQISSEYQFVAAVNNMVDPSPRKSSSGNSLSSYFAYQLDRSPSFPKDSLPFVQPDHVDGTSAPYNSGGFLHCPAPSPPFSPRPVQQIDTKPSMKQLYDNRFLADQALDDQYETDSYYVHGPKFSATMLNDAEMTISSRGVPFQNRHISDLITPSFSRNYSDLGQHSYYEKPAQLEKPFHSDKFPEQRDDSLGWVTGSEDLVGPSQGIPHAYSDSLLQGHGDMNISGLTEATASQLGFSKSPHLQQFCGSILQGRATPIQDYRESNQPYLQFQTQGIRSDNSQVRTELSSTSHYPESSVRNEPNYQVSDYFNGEHQYGERIYGVNFGLRDCHVRHELVGDKPVLKSEKGVRIAVLEVDTYKGNLLDPQYKHIDIHDAPVYSQEMEALGNSVPRQSFVNASSHPDSLKGHSIVDQMNKTTTEVPGDSSERLCSDLVPVGRNIVAFSPPVLLKKEPLESALSVKLIEHATGEQYGGGKFDDLISSSSGEPIYQISPDIISQNLMDNKEPELASSGNSAQVALALIDDAALSLNIRINDPPTWSLFQSPAMDEVLKRDVFPLDQFMIKSPESGFRYLMDDRQGIKHLKGGDTDSLRDKHEHVQMGTMVTVEDVTGLVPSGIPVSPPIVPHVLHEAAEDVETNDTSPSKVTDLWCNTLESECEEHKDDERDVDASISDSAIAEMEAGIYGLQIIKNADLEDLRELGSGTFGTVYHGKWRGTDVAIKRIKKSCFAGRASEQERLTKDFWREAQILSKLHHPNVVAFYGVVPDGTGGTLATVAEFMVNGSLKHVLLRKDRTLDRRKRLMIAMDAAFGMEYLHLKNIVHFDLKCDNLLVNLRDPQRPICKVGDFGLSRIKRNTLVSGGVRGTLPWMAPELLNGSSIRVSEKVDVFSFGIAMWEILTGEEPYANMHCGAIIGGIVNNTLRPSIPARCDTEWRKLMEECWSPDPALRPSFSDITVRLRAMSAALQPKGLSGKKMI